MFSLLYFPLFLSTIQASGMVCAPWSHRESAAGNCQLSASPRGFCLPKAKIHWRDFAKCLWKQKKVGVLQLQPKQRGNSFSSNNGGKRELPPLSHTARGSSLAKVSESGAVCLPALLKSLCSNEAWASRASTPSIPWTW